MTKTIKNNWYSLLRKTFSKQNTFIKYIDILHNIWSIEKTLVKNPNT